MTLATVDDLLAIILIAVFFSSLEAWYWFVGIGVCALVWWYLVRRKRVPWLVVAVVGVLVWIMMFEAGVHPTLAGVLVGLLTPGASDSRRGPRPVPNATASSSNRFRRWWRCRFSRCSPPACISRRSAPRC